MSEDEEVLMDTDSEEELSDENFDFAAYLSQFAFPELPSVNKEYFDGQFTQNVFAAIYGPMYCTSYALKYYYSSYPMIKDPKVLEEENLETLQRQLVLQGNKQYSMLFAYDAPVISKICQSGCFPLGNTIEGVENVLVKLHKQRCVLSNISETLHISRAVKKKSKRYMITVNADYTRCVEEIHKYHDNSWLFPRLRECFAQMNKHNNLPTKVYSFELWNISGQEELPVSVEELKQTCTLVAGEIGYSCGSCYTSLTGYHTENSSGSIQLVGTGKLLAQLGYEMWDFGMAMAYKETLGAKSIDRMDFIQQFHSVSQKTTENFPEKPILVSTLVKRS